MQPHDANAQPASPDFSKPSRSGGTASPKPASERSKPQLRGRLGRLLWAPLDLYALGGLGYLILKTALGDRFWPVAMVDNISFWLLLPTLPLLALAAWRRRWRSAAPLGVIVVGFLWLFGGLFAPRFVPTSVCASSGDGCSVRLRVMSMNMWYDRSDTDRLLAEIRRNDPDIVALVEYTKSRAAAFQTALGDVYPYRVQFDDGIPGIGLISKYPIHDPQKFRVRSVRLSHMRATVDVDGQLLTVIVVHTDRPVLSKKGGALSYVNRASADIAEMSRMAASGGPTLLMGDFNTSEVADDYRVLVDAGLVDSFRESGYGLGTTWPVGHRRLPPLVRIDYIWHTRHFTSLNAWVGNDTGSDHLPVIADLVWEQQ